VVDGENESNAVVDGDVLDVLRFQSTNWSKQFDSVRVLSGARPPISSSMERPRLRSRSPSNGILRGEGKRRGSLARSSNVKDESRLPEEKACREKG